MYLFTYAYSDEDANELYSGDIKENMGFTNIRQNKV